MQPPDDTFGESAAARILIKTSLYLLPYSDTASRCLDAGEAAVLLFDPCWRPALGTAEQQLLTALAPGACMLSWVARSTDAHDFASRAAALKQDMDRYTLLLWLRQLSLNYHNPLPPLYQSSCDRARLLAARECLLKPAAAALARLEASGPSPNSKFPAPKLLSLLPELCEDARARELWTAAADSAGEVLKILELKNIQKQNLKRSALKPAALALYCTLLKCACRWYAARKKGGAAAAFTEQLHRSFQQQQKQQARCRRQLEELCAGALPGFDAAAAPAAADRFIAGLMEHDDYLLWEAPRLRIIAGMFSAYGTYCRMRTLNGPGFELALENLSGLRREQVLFLLRLDQASTLPAAAAAG